MECETCDDYQDCWTFQLKNKKNIHVHKIIHIHVYTCIIIHIHCTLLLYTYVCICKTKTIKNTLRSQDKGNTIHNFMKIESTTSQSMLNIPRAEITFPRQTSDLLMFPPSFSLMPSAPVALTRSLQYKDASHNVHNVHYVREYSTSCALCTMQVLILCQWVRAQCKNFLPSHKVYLYLPNIIQEGEYMQGSGWRDIPTPTCTYTYLYMYTQLTFQPSPPG